MENLEKYIKKDISEFAKFYDSIFLNLNQAVDLKKTLTNQII
jgi:hypothetical protein